jgi:hypothetical protein
MKLPGQVREAINAYPDPTHGLVKRSGTKITKELGQASLYDDSHWFSIFRDRTEGYVGCIKGNEIHIWNVTDGTKATVTYEGSSQSYLGATKNDYHVLSIQDLSVVTNKTTVVKALAAPAVAPGTHATMRIMAANYRCKYEVTINGVSKSWVTRNTDAQVEATDPPKEEITVNEIMDKFITEINSMAIPGLTVTKLRDTLELKSDTPFTISSKSGSDNEVVQVFTDTVTTIADLPKESVHGRVITITNTASDDDTYYVQFIAEDKVSGKGYWEETVKPGISLGLDPSTMPHELKNTAKNTFVFRALEKDPADANKFFWEPRLVGDDTSNEHPSFVNNKIEQAFFYNNRMGFLTKDNVSMSQAGEYFNFYHMSALTQTAADPIDISCSSVKPAVLHGVLPSAQGLVLFSNTQQFLMTGPNGILTAAGSTIATISNYEMDDFVDPVDMGTSFVFISKTPSFSRVFEMVTKGQEENPIVTDIGRIAGDWLPENIDQLVANPQNSFFTVASQQSPFMHMLRSYAEGEEVIVSGWVKWQLPGNIQYHAVDRDIVYFLTDVDGFLILSQANLNQSTRDEVLVSPDGSRVDPRLDLWTLATNITYDPIARTSKLYVDHSHYNSLNPIIITVERASTARSGKAVAGSFFKVLIKGTDATGSFFTVRHADLTKYSKVAVGYTYNFQVDLPTQYYLQNNQTDYSASLTIARYKFAVGLSGILDFKVKAQGRTEWEDRQPVIDANYYHAGTSAMTDQKILTVPIHQKSTQHSVRVVSDSPYPSSLISMVWEGMYSPRYYQRS